VQTVICFSVCCCSLTELFRLHLVCRQARRHASSGALGDTQREKKAAAAPRASADSVFPEDKENGDEDAAAPTPVAAPVAVAAPLAPLSAARTNAPPALPAPMAKPAAATASAEAAVEPALPRSSTAAASANVVAEALKLKLAEAELRQSGLMLHVEGVEKERDFYYAKLQVCDDRDA
jgi:hypothetical protein